MGHSELVKKIKTRGYWRVNFQPLSIKEGLPLSMCLEVVEQNKVYLRGWEYPAIPRRNDDEMALERHNDFVQGWTDWEIHKEFWRMYRSRQFLAYRALRDDWMDSSTLGARPGQFEPGKVVSVIGSVVFELTEAFEFLARLTRAGLYEEGARVSVALHGASGKKLWLGGDRFPFQMDYTTSAEVVGESRTFSKEEMLASPLDRSADWIDLTLERFGWKFAREQVRQEQERLMTRRF